MVDGLELMRQRVYTEDGEAEVVVELVGDAEGIGLQAKAKEAAVAIVGAPCIQDSEILEVSSCQCDPAEPLQLRADEASHSRVWAVPCLSCGRRQGAHGLHRIRLIVEQGIGEHLAFVEVWLAHRGCFFRGVLVCCAVNFAFTATSLCQKRQGEVRSGFPVVTVLSVTLTFKPDAGW